MPSAALNLTLPYVLMAGCGLAGLRLWRTGLYRRYRALLGFLLVTIVYQALVLLLSSTDSYRTFWVVAQPLTWLFSVWIVLELYSLILERYKGLSTLGRWIQYVGFTFSTIVSVLAMVPKIHEGARQFSSLIAYYYGIERGIDCGMLVFLLVILLWLCRYPVPLSRNVILHSLTYSMLFLTNSIGLFVQVLFGLPVSTNISTVLTVVYAGCILAWAFVLTTKGEEVQVVVPRFNPEQEKLILERLDALNKAMLKVSRN